MKHELKTFKPSQGTACNTNCGVSYQWCLWSIYSADLQEILKKFTVVKTAVIWLAKLREISKEVFSNSNKLFCGSVINKWPCVKYINYLIKWNPSVCSLYWKSKIKGLSTGSNCPGNISEDLAAIKRRQLQNIIDLMINQKIQICFVHID